MPMLELDPHDAAAWKARAELLWQMLDDIETYGEIAKSDDRLYRNLVERKHQERYTVLASDGYRLYVPGEEPQRIDD